jgi:hypothetical protein
MDMPGLFCETVPSYSYAMACIQKNPKLQRIRALGLTPRSGGLFYEFQHRPEFLRHSRIQFGIELPSGPRGLSFCVLTIPELGHWHRLGGQGLKGARLALFINFHYYTILLLLLEERAIM